MNNDFKNPRNLSLLADFYEFTMANGFMDNDVHNTIAYYDMFFRTIPDEGGFAITAGLEQLINYLNNLHFSKSDIDYLNSLNLFSQEFLNYLKNFEFQCDIWAIPEGTPVFPQEPLVIVRGPIIQAQMVETMVLLTMNHQSLIATKANRMVRAAEGRGVVEFGSRRAHSYDSANYGARATYIGGCTGTANTLAGKMFDIPVAGTMAHSWVQMFPSEIDAFRAYARTYPDNCLLLVDTYDTLKEGIPNAIKVFNEEVVPRGFRPKGIRLDSGDISYLSKEARKMLDDAGYKDAIIMASSGLDEHIINNLIEQDAKVDSFGVGERMITARSEPVFGGVYKLTATENDDNEIIPTIKISENVAKITTPGFKQVHRLFDKNTNKAIADVITLHDEEINNSKPYEIFHPLYTWKRKTITNFYSEKLLVPIFKKGKLVYEIPTIKDIVKHREYETNRFWSEVKRFKNPHEYFVDLSFDLWEIKDKLLRENRK